MSEKVIGADVAYEGTFLYDNFKRIKVQFFPKNKTAKIISERGDFEIYELKNRFFYWKESYGVSVTENWREEDWERLAKRLRSLA